MLITVSPAGRGRFSARLADGRVLCASASEPFLSAARVLLREGVPASTTIESRHEGSSIVSMRSTVGAAAALSVSEGDLAPRFVPYREPTFRNPREPVGSPSETDEVDLEAMEVA